MEEQTVDEEKLWKLLEQAIKGAAQGFVETRIKEGENIRDDLVAKLDAMLSHVDFIESRSPQIIAEYKQKLKEEYERVTLGVRRFLEFGQP